MSFFRTLSATAQTILKTVEVTATKATTLVDVAGASIDELDRWTKDIYANNGATRDANRLDNIKNIVEDTRKRRTSRQAELLQLIENDDKFAEIWKESEEEFKTMEAELLAKYAPK